MAFISCRGDVIGRSFKELHHIDIKSAIYNSLCTFFDAVGAKKGGTPNTHHVRVREPCPNQRNAVGKFRPCAGDSGLCPENLQGF